MSGPPSQNGAFSRPGPYRPGPGRTRARDMVRGVGDAWPNPAASAVERPPVSGCSLVAAWVEMGWDPVRMCWTDPEALAQAAESAARTAAEIETYPGASAAELVAARDRELREAS